MNKSCINTVIGLRNCWKNDNNQRTIDKDKYLIQLMELKNKLSGGINRKDKSVELKRNTLNSCIKTIQQQVNANNYNKTQLAKILYNELGGGFYNDGHYISKSDIYTFVQLVINLSIHANCQDTKINYFGFVNKTAHINLALDYKSYQKYVIKLNRVGSYSDIDIGSDEYKSFAKHNLDKTISHDKLYDKHAKTTRELLIINNKPNNTLIDNNNSYTQLHTNTIIEENI